MKSIVLLSGGLDSGVLLADTLDRAGESTETLALSFNYGQRHSKELEYAKKLAKHYEVDHQICTLRGVFDPTILTNPQEEVPHTTYSELKGLSPLNVPFRNGIFLSIAASLALSRGYDTIRIATHAEDAANWAYPDCTPEFNGGMGNAIFVGTHMEVRLEAPFQYFQKWEVVRRGLELQVPFQWTWSCYEGGETPCGECPTCRERREAFRRNGIE